MSEAIEAPATEAQEQSERPTESMKRVAKELRRLADDVENGRTEALVFASIGACTREGCDATHPQIFTWVLETVEEKASLATHLLGAVSFARDKVSQMIDHLMLMQTQARMQDMVEASMSPKH